MVIIHTSMMKIPIIILTFLALITVITAPNPPVWAVRFQHEFTEGYTSTVSRDLGKIWYDAGRGLQRIDRNSGKFDYFCGAISSLVTICIQLVKDNRNWIYFPLIGQCCLCCEKSNGCGMLRQDWLRNTRYVGTEVISGQSFNKYVDEESGIDYWTTTDSKQISRRLVEDGSVTKDFVLNTYSEGPIQETIWNLPNYCNPAKLCPGPCSKFRS